MTARCRVLIRHWPLGVSDDRLEALRAMLSDDEREQAARLRLPDVARSYVAARATTRLLLAGDCGCGPTDLVFDRAASGKPALAAPWPGPIFNISHSGGVCALATLADGGGCPVRLGIDIETIRPVERDIALAYFTAREAAWLDSLEPAARERSFIRLWVLKEAYLKATGEGLQGGLDQLEVDVGTLRPTGRVDVVSVGGCGSQAQAWWLATFAISDRILGGLALHGCSGRPDVEVVEAF